MTLMLRCPLASLAAPTWIFDVKVDEVTIGALACISWGGSLVPRPATLMGSSSEWTNFGQVMQSNGVRERTAIAAALVQSIVPSLGTGRNRRSGASRAFVRY